MAFFISLTISTLHFTIPYGFGAATRYPLTSRLVQQMFIPINLKTKLWLIRSTRVSNELGAGNPEVARMAVKVGMSMATTEAITVSAALFFSRHIVGYAYSNEKPVVAHVAEIAPLLCISLVTDSIQVVLSGK